MSSKYLDKDGLSHLWSKIKAFFVKGNGKLFYGTCSTGASTATKAVTCSDFISTDLVAGTIISVKFSNTNSAAASSLKLNVNSTGAKNIKCISNGDLIDIQPSYLKANQIYTFIYDGTYWVVQMDHTINSTNAIKIATVYDEVVSLSTGNNTINFNLPNDYTQSLGVSISHAWPSSTWVNANVTISRDGTVVGNEGKVDIFVGSTQNYRLRLTLIYI